MAGSGIWWMWLPFRHFGVECAKQWKFTQIYGGMLSTTVSGLSTSKMHAKKEIWRTIRKGMSKWNSERRGCGKKTLKKKNMRTGSWIVADEGTFKALKLNNYNCCCCCWTAKNVLLDVDWRWFVEKAGNGVAANLHVRSLWRSIKRTTQLPVDWGAIQGRK